MGQASTDNERCVYIIKDEDGRSWTVVQIAGLIARRIVSRVEQGDRLFYVSAARLNQPSLAGS